MRLPRLRRIYLMGLCLLWAGCGPAPAPPTDTPRPATIATNTPLVYVDCAWSWANRPLPELTDQLQAALDAAGIPGATARAYDFGENCNNQETGTVRFARIETDVEIRLEVTDPQDLDALGSLTDQVVAVLDTFVRDSLSGRQPGRIGLNFTLRGGAGHWLYFYDEQLAEARGRGLSGRALLEALGYPP